MLIKHNTPSPLLIHLMSKKLSVHTLSGNVPAICLRWHFADLLPQNMLQKPDPNITSVCFVFSANHYIIAAWRAQHLNFKKRSASLRSASSSCISVYVCRAANLPAVRADSTSSWCIDLVQRLSISSCLQARRRIPLQSDKTGLRLSL